MEIAVDVAAMALFCRAAAGDWVSRRIPNWIVVAVVVLAFAKMLIVPGHGPGPAALDLGVAVLVFAGGAVLFRLGLFGGGDVKLMAAGALWLGASATGAFVLATALAGGLLGLGFVIARRSGRAGDASGAAPSLPYGVAIGAAGILATLGLV